MARLGDSADSVVNPWTLQERVGLLDARYALDSTLMPRRGVSYIDYRSGVMAAGDTGGVGGSSHMAMRVQAAGGMQITVEAGNPIINTTNYGAYMGCLDSQKTLTLEPASTSSNRIDIVIARIYDDLNPAIGSPQDERRLRVEVWSGTETTGTPVEEDPPPAAGWIKLAAIRVNKGISEITTSMITDLRGPGLVTRGGMRALYGEDTKPGAEAYDEPGAYPGDQRWVHSNLFQHQVYYGDGPDPTRSGWRGVFNCLVLNANPTSGERVWAKGVGGVVECCRVHIPYPGTPFMVYPTGRCSGQMSYNTVASLRTSIGSPTGPQINFASQQNAFGGDMDYYASISPIMWGPFTDAVDIVLNIIVNRTPTPNHGAAYDRTGNTLLTVCVFPSTVQPPTA